MEIPMKIKMKPLKTIVSLCMLWLAMAASAKADGPRNEPVSFSRVTIEDSFWRPRIERLSEVTVPFCLDQCAEKTHRVENFAIAAGVRKGQFEGLFYDDSDLYKMIEGASYSLQNTPDKALESRLDSIITLIAGAQGKDGYINTYFTLMKPGKRWTDMDKHEMYCGGHLIEAGIAYHKATGKRLLLDVAERFADYLVSEFGPGKRDWVPGHPEIELALIRLYRETAKKEYLELAHFLLEERGRGKADWKAYDYYLDKVPVAGLDKIGGHAVRAMYLLTGMADYSATSGDTSYIAALDRLWDNVVKTRMYLTGGIGSSRRNEGFTEDYDLPNKEAYCETCASVGMVMWNQRMNMLKGESRYVDVLERAMYNGALAGISLSSDRFFYVNPLASDGNHHRKPWYGTACCPSQISRFLPSVGGYIYARSDDALWVNLYVSGKVETEISGVKTTFSQKTEYPWDGTVLMTVSPEKKAAFAVRLRIPGWCEEWNVSVNGKTVRNNLDGGYVVLERKWKKGDRIVLEMNMPVRVVAADPKVKADIGKRAVQRGPIVYCMEQVDNAGFDSARLTSDDVFQCRFEPETLGGVCTVTASSDGRSLRFVPYYAWDNRAPGKMKVWVEYESDAVDKQSRLQPTAYQELPLGAVKAEGWLKEMLLRQRNGMTSRMDVLYPQVMGDRNGWLGGDGDQWERGPYWIDGLLPLAYILDDQELKDKAQPWIEWALASQREDGFFGPARDYPFERGLQRNNSHDWWPRMVVLKVLQQYWSATGDERVINFMRRYFRYQLATLPETPLGKWTFWAEYRACDNLNMVLWLYDVTKESWLIDLAGILHDQGHDYVRMFLETDDLHRLNTIHCVNLAQGIKEPVVYWRVDPDQKYLDAVDKAFSDIRQYNGFPNGMYGGDEALHGNNPTQGSELCSAVELMYSLEEMMKITGRLEYVDHLERVAFNALPSQITDDFMARQYFQQPNQVQVTKCIHNFDINHGNTDLVFGLLTGYPCCTSNLHQGWPKFTRNLWLSSPDGGLAALAYSPSSVRKNISGVDVLIMEKTHYPMDGRIDFEVSVASGGKVSFPLHLRVPSWSVRPSLTVNGEPVSVTAGSIAVVDREWSDGDRVELDLPMEVSLSEWYENSVAVERGPLVYALKMKEKWVRHDIEEVNSIYGKDYWEVLPESPWNYGIIDPAKTPLSDCFEVKVDEERLDSEWYWNPESAPVSIMVNAKRIPSWKLYNGMAGPQPYSRMYGPDTKEVPVERITLIPYGCTTLRISEFPVIRE